MGDQGVSTQLLVPSGSVCFSYASTSWKLFLRKEVGTRVGPQPDLSLGWGGAAGCGGCNLGPQHLLLTHKHWGPPPHYPPPQASFSIWAWEAEVGRKVGLWGGGLHSRLLSLPHALLQVFYPRENFSHAYCLRLLCEQVRARPT